MFSVVIRERGGSVTVQTFDKTEVSVGRIGANDIVLPKGNISKRHARVVHREDDFVVVDLRSTNGTYVNGHKVGSPMVISEDDKVYVGDFVLQVRRGEVSADSIPAETEGAETEMPQGHRPADAKMDPESIEIVDSPESDPVVTAAPAVGAGRGIVDPFEETSDGHDLSDQFDFSGDESEGEELGTMILDDDEPMEPPAAAMAPSSTGASAAGASATGSSATEAHMKALDLDDALPPEETYRRVLAHLYDRAARTVFANQILNPADFESQWHEFERAVFHLVERARSGGEIPSDSDAAQLTTDLLYEFMALGPIEHLLADESATEIFVDGFDHMSVRRGGELVLEPSYAFSSEASFVQAIERLVQNHASNGDDGSIHTGRLDDGTWFHVTLPPASAQGPVLHLSRPASEPARLDDWVGDGRASSAAVEALRLAVGDRDTSIVIGSRSLRAAGALIGSLLHEVSARDRIGLLQGRAEMAVPVGAHVVRFDAESFEAVNAASASGMQRVVAHGVDASTLGELVHVGATQRGGLIVAIRARGADDLALRLRALQDPSIPRENAAQLGALAFDYAVFVEADSHGRAKLMSVHEIRTDAQMGLALREVAGS